MHEDKYSLTTIPDDSAIGIDVVYFESCRLAKKWLNALTTFSCYRELKDTWSNRVIARKHFDQSLTS
jgi:hypothetical protein